MQFYTPYLITPHLTSFQGARFDQSSGLIVESRPGRMYDLLPAIHFIPAVNHRQTPSTYACPVYKTAVRKGSSWVHCCAVQHAPSQFPFLLSFCSQPCSHSFPLLSSPLFSSSSPLLSSHRRYLEHDRHVHQLCRAHRAAYSSR